MGRADSGIWLRSLGAACTLASWSFKRAQIYSRYLEGAFWDWAVPGREVGAGDALGGPP